MTLIVGTAIPHQESDRCNGLHCHSCNLDEQGHAYQWCSECGHGYETPQDLRTAYLQEAPYGPWHWRWWRIVFTPAHKLLDRITFCPLCMHDF